MRRQYQIRICREGWYYLVVMAFILAGAMLRQINLLIIFFGMLAGVALVSWKLVKATLRRMEVQRNLPDSVSAGDLLVVELLVRNPRRKLAAWAIDAEDRIQRDAPEASGQPMTASALVPYIPAGESRSAFYRGRLTERGRYRFGPVAIATRFPLGLIRYRIAFEQPQVLTVFPRLGRLKPAWTRLQESVDRGLERMAQQQGFLEGEFYGLRDWRSGDSRRWVHWRTSARRQTVVVRQFEQQRNQDLALVVELWQPEQPEPANLDAVELAVSFAATIVADLCRRGGKWLCISLAGAEPWLESGPTSTALLHQAMRGLAVARSSADDSLPRALAAALDHIRTGTRVVVVGTRKPDLDDATRFGALLRHGRHRQWMGKIHSIDASRDELAEYFVPV